VTQVIVIDPKASRGRSNLKICHDNARRGHATMSDFNMVVGDFLVAPLAERELYLTFSVSFCVQVLLRKEGIGKWPAAT